LLHQDSRKKKGDEDGKIQTKKNCPVGEKKEVTTISLQSSFMPVTTTFTERIRGDY